MSKGMRMEEKIREIAGETGDCHGWPPAYVAYFSCFNAGEYYEAHDVLEHLWLRTDGPESLYFKGLIQFAGAFVHLRKQYLRPHHHKDGRRLAPAARLFQLALQNWKTFPSEVWGLDLDGVRDICREQLHVLELGNYTRNPWRPCNAPKLHPDAKGPKRT
jgi:predicted metal-dependent hydrolase